MILFSFFFFGAICFLIGTCYGANLSATKQLEQISLNKQTVTNNVPLMIPKKKISKTSKNKKEEEREKRERDKKDLERILRKEREREKEKDLERREKEKKKEKKSKQPDVVKNNFDNQESIIIINQ